MRRLLASAPRHLLEFAGLGRCEIPGPLPKVLAGPIVRRVEQRSCSFWVALSQEATVTALLWKGERNAPVSSADTPAGSGEL